LEHTQHVDSYRLAVASYRLAATSNYLLAATRKLLAGSHNSTSKTRCRIHAEKDPRAQGDISTAVTCPPECPARVDALPQAECTYAHLARRGGVFVPPRQRMLVLIADVDWHRAELDASLRRQAPGERGGRGRQG